MCNHEIVINRSDLMILSLFLMSDGSIGFKSITLKNEDGRLPGDEPFYQGCRGCHPMIEGNFRRDLHWYRSETHS